jgi:spore coat polysaccharide biosynthesis protein SpsF
MDKIVAIIQARMGSERLHGKVMKNLIGFPMLVHVVQRVARSRLIDEIVLAIPESPENDCLLDLCDFYHWNCYRGSEEDVLDRYYNASKMCHADIIVRITSDCPLIDPELMDKTINKIKSTRGIDYVSNCCPQRTYPRGLDTEIIRFCALEKSWHEDKNLLSREHVTRYVVRNPDKFIIEGVMDEENNSMLRWTVDTEEDFALITEIYNHFGNNLFSWKDALNFIRDNPSLNAINAHIPQKEVP